MSAGEGVIHKNAPDDTCIYGQIRKNYLNNAKLKRRTYVVSVNIAKFVRRE